MLGLVSGLVLGSRLGLGLEEVGLGLGLSPANESSVEMIRRLLRLTLTLTRSPDHTLKLYLDWNTILKLGI